jgi:hypothetical protein
LGFIQESLELNESIDSCIIEISCVICAVQARKFSLKSVSCSLEAIVFGGLISQFSGSSNVGSGLKLISVLIESCLLVFEFTCEVFENKSKSVLLKSSLGNTGSSLSELLGGKGSVFGTLGGVLRLSIVLCNQAYVECGISLQVSKFLTSLLDIELKETNSSFGIFLTQVSVVFISASEVSLELESGSLEGSKFLLSLSSFGGIYHSIDGIALLLLSLF